MNVMLCGYNENREQIAKPSGTQATFEKYNNESNTLPASGQKLSDNWLSIFMKKLFLLFALFLPLSLLGQSKNDSLFKAQLTRLEAQLNKSAELSSRIPELEKRIDNQGSLYDRTLNSISVQISAASLCLTLFGILFGIVGIGLGVYITVVERKVVRIREENKSLLKQSQDIKEEVVALNNLVQSDIRGLYQKLKREETVSMLERLILVPHDIINLGDLLFSRDLVDNDFSSLKLAYSKLGPNTYVESSYGYILKHPWRSYKKLFFQHFLRQSLTDKALQVEMIEFLPAGIEEVFHNDIIKSTKDLTRAVLELDIKNCGSIITRFFEGLSASEFKNFTDIYQLIFNELGPRLNQFEFFNIVSETPQARIATIHFGDLLLEAYTGKELSVAEQKVFTKLQQLKDEQKQPEEPKADNN